MKKVFFIFAVGLFTVSIQSCLETERETDDSFEQIGDFADSYETREETEMEMEEEGEEAAGDIENTIQ